VRQTQWLGFGLLVLVTLARVTSAQTKPPELNVLCSVTQAWCELVAKSYSAAKINLVRLSSAEALRACL
jgi:hypothetical protein